MLENVKSDFAREVLLFFFFWQAGRGADDAPQTVRLSAAMHGHLCVRVRVRVYVRMPGPALS